MTIRTQLTSLILIVGTLLLPALGAAQTSTTLTALDKSIDPRRNHVRSSKSHHSVTVCRQHDGNCRLSSTIPSVNPAKPFTVKNESFIKDYDGIIT
jgi:hypothetical protein